MESILTLAKTEGMLFKFGSGTGTNLSSLRSSREKLAGGGTASGPVSFMKGYDAFAGVIKSGGKTRRAAKMVILNADHPDIVDFITCKVERGEEGVGTDRRRLRRRRFNGAAYVSVFFQNSNNTRARRRTSSCARCSTTANWQTTSGHRRPARWTPTRPRASCAMIAEATHVCGDPGMQFDTTINEWHTCPNTARINASNPCSEYMFLDDSACNLASINLMKFVDERWRVRRRRVPAPRWARSSSPRRSWSTTRATRRRAIEKNSHDYRPLGLGYANLGALLMSRGLPYDCDAGRALCGGDHRADDRRGLRDQSSRIARDHGGPFAGYQPNREPFLRVMRKHRRAR